VLAAAAHGLFDRQLRHAGPTTLVMFTPLAA
jgi:hypothetical protein